MGSCVDGLSQLRTTTDGPPEVQGSTESDRDAPDLVELVRGVARSDPAAVGEMLHRFGSDVRRVLRRIVGTSSEVDDLAQEVFVRATDRIRRLENPFALRSWLIAIAVRVAREHLRHRRVRQWVLFFAPTDVPEASAFDDPEAPEELRAALRIVDSLGPDLRIVFALRYLEGLELSEIASSCGTSLATVKRRLATAETKFFDRARASDALVRWLGEASR